MCTKTCFTKKEAEIALKDDVRRPRKWRKEIRKYYCGGCNAWHLTSQELIDHTIPPRIDLQYFRQWKKLKRA